MATTTQEHPVGVFGHERRFWTELSAGMGTEALVGAGAVILAIVGLAGLEAFYMAAIATIAVGAAFLLEGAVLMAKQAEMTTSEGTPSLSAELLGGAVGIVLGILALVGVVPTILLAVALLVYGVHVIGRERDFAHAKFRV